MGGTRAKAVFWKGGFSEDVEEGLASEHWRGKFIRVSDGDEINFTEQMLGLDLADAVVLFKGSRMNRMEVFFEAVHKSLQENHKN